MRICKTCIYVNIRLCFNMHNNDPRSPMLHHNLGKQVHYTLDVCTDIYLINQTKDWILLLLKLGKYPTQISIIQKRCQHAVSKLDFSWTSYPFKAIRSTKMVSSPIYLGFTTSKIMVNTSISWLISLPYWWLTYNTLFQSHKNILILLQLSIGSNNKKYWSLPNNHMLWHPCSTQAYRKILQLQKAVLIA